MRTKILIMYFFLPDHQGIQQVSPKKYLNTTYVMAAFE